MCGICGFVGIQDDELLERMTCALAHRGPDSAGYFRDGDVGLGHRRLSIIDVAGGQQPLFNENRKLALICNGEVYNYKELREELRAKGHHFSTSSDSEVILHLYEELGTSCVERLIGMYAFAIWDGERGHLFLVRDRLGVKPMYYAERPGGVFLFASESKALLRHAGLSPTLAPEAVHDYLALRYVPGNGSMIREIRKFPAAHWAIVRDGRATLQRYWEPELFAGPFDRSDDEYLEGFAERFETSIRRRLISDVPLGAYLSGGLDSSVIVAAMARLASEPVRTFTVGFDYEHDELGEAAETAKLLGCRHTELACRIEDVSLLPDIVWHLDEPVGDAIVIPMYLLAREAKREVTVILTGEGADETLGGYLFHKVLLRAHTMGKLLPHSLRRALLMPLLRATPVGALDMAFDYPAALGRRGRQKLVDFVELIGPEQLPEAYRHLISLFDARDTGDLYTADFRHALNGTHAGSRDWQRHSGVPFLNEILHLQFEHWLPDDILTKQDKTSMASAIEARVPFLDHELVEYALRIPPRLKIRGSQSKYILRRYAERLLPPPVVNRPKRPFYAPMEKYMADPVFQDLVDDTLSERSVRERGILRPEAVDRLRDSMRGGEFLHVKQVFSLVVLELWFRMAMDRGGVREGDVRTTGV